MALNGGKSYLASRIIALMPPRSQWCHYVEPYAGGLSVLLAQNPEGISEVVNDLSGDLVNFWRVLQKEDSFAAFKRMVEAIPFSEAEWQEAHTFCTKLRYTVSDVEGAVSFFVHCRQSLAGRMTHFAPLSKSRTRRGMNEQVSAWLTCITGLPEVHTRLKRVVIRNKDALDVILAEDSCHTLYYCDPPYVHETRTSTTEYGDNEMSLVQHDALLSTLSKIKGKFLLSGYRSDLYESYASANHWTRHEFDLPNNAATGGSKRRMIECVWSNF